MNVDGASKGNPGPSGFGGIVRDNKAKLVIAYANPGGILSNSEKLMHSLKVGLQMFLEFKLNFIQIESDSLMVVNVLNRNWKPPWKFLNCVADIRSKLNLLQYSLKHCYRESGY